VPRPSPESFERYRRLLRLEVRRLQLDPRLKRLWDSSDVVQDVFRRALEKFDQFKGETEGELVCWLKSILQSLVKDLIDAAHAQKRDIDLIQSMDEALTQSRARIEDIAPAPDSSPSKQAERHEKEMQLAAAVHQLPENQRDVIICRYLHQMRIAAIAEQVGKTERAVMGLLNRGTIRLRELLDGSDSKSQ
jgi:RNA polymerase sigma-70 factor (ECF subfamily)